MDYEAFFQFLETERNISAQTIRAYRNDLKLFDSFLCERSIRHITRVDHAVINDYIKAMREIPNPLSKRQNRRHGLDETDGARQSDHNDGLLRSDRYHSCPRLLLGHGTTAGSIVLNSRIPARRKNVSNTKQLADRK